MPRSFSDCGWIHSAAARNNPWRVAKLRSGQAGPQAGAYRPQDPDARLAVVTNTVGEASAGRPAVAAAPCPGAGRGAAARRLRCRRRPGRWGSRPAAAARPRRHRLLDAVCQPVRPLRAGHRAGDFDTRADVRREVHVVLRGQRHVIAVFGGDGGVTAFGTCLPVPRLARGSACTSAWPRRCRLCGTVAPGRCRRPLEAACQRESLLITGSLRPGLACGCHGSGGERRECARDDSHSNEEWASS